MYLRNIFKTNRLIINILTIHAIVKYCGAGGLPLHGRRWRKGTFAGGDPGLCRLVTEGRLPPGGADADADAPVWTQPDIVERRRCRWSRCAPLHWISHHDVDWIHPRSTTFLLDVTPTPSAEASGPGDLGDERGFPRSRVLGPGAVGERLGTRPVGDGVLFCFRRSMGAVWLTDPLGSLSPGAVDLWTCISISVFSIWAEDEGCHRFCTLGPGLAGGPFLAGPEAKELPPELIDVLKRLGMN